MNKKKFNAAVKEYDRTIRLLLFHWVKNDFWLTESIEFVALNIANDLSKRFKQNLFMERIGKTENYRATIQFVRYCLKLANEMWKELNKNKKEM